MKELTVPAATDRLDQVLDFIQQELEARDCPLKIQMQVAVAAEEIFVNIAHYAYHPETGEATVRVEVADEPLQVILTFLDQGQPYNPLSHQDPDTSLGAEERDIGGLGIYMVKRTMDSVEYRYEEGRNILVIRKSW